MAPDHGRGLIVQALPQEFDLFWQTIAMGAALKISAELRSPFPVVTSVQLPTDLDLDELEPLKVVVADDHELMREGIVAVVSRQPGFVVAGCAIDAAAAFALLARHRPDLLLIDVFLGGNQGAHLVNELVTCYPETRILALCAFEEQTSAQRFLCAGAAGFLVKSASSAQLIEALITIAQGKTYSNQRIRTGNFATGRPQVLDNGR